MTITNETLTGGIFYCRDSAGYSILASNKLSCNLIGKCSEIGNKNIPPAVRGNRLPKKQTNITR